MTTRVWVKGIDEVEKIFESYRKATRTLDRLADELNSICIRETQNFSPEPGGGSCEVPELQRYVEHKDQIRQRMVQQLNKIAEKYDQALDLVDKLEGHEYSVVKVYYIDGKTMREVSAKIGCAERHCWRIRDEAFRTISKHVIECHADL